MIHAFQPDTITGYHRDRKIKSLLPWFDYRLRHTTQNKTKYMNVMSEILKAGWLELQLVTDVLGMSPLAGNKTGFSTSYSRLDHTHHLAHRAINASPSKNMLYTSQYE